MARDLATFGIRVLHPMCRGNFDTPLLRAIPQEGLDQLISTVPFPN